MSNKTLVAMRRADGTMDSEVHFAGHIVRPDHQTGVVLIPAEFVLSMMMAGYVHTEPTT
jgi:hypothetical protein